MGEDTVDQSGRDWKRIGLVVGCLGAAIVLSVLMPTFATDGMAGTPIERVLPGEDAEAGATGGGEWDGAGEQGLGALNPGPGTGVGGEVALDSDTYGSTDTELHFTVESSQPTYWRTAAFDTYTGSGWERPTETDPIDGSIDHRGPDGEQIDYELELAQSATAVPTAYRPAVVEGIDDPEVTQNGAIQVDSPLEPGTTIEGVSFAPEDDVDRLRSSSEDYPAEIEDRYTQMPDDTPSRLEPRTEEIIEDADATDPYEQAVAVQEYLRDTKGYSLGVSERDDSIADTFLFEMDEGYCEYFATAMATMLRTQDIPTRYVVGYSTGQQVEDGVYEVRAMNAHAWVEVYFEDTGWVRFDPTPGEQRLDAQEEALDDLDEEFDLGHPGGPGESFDPDSGEEGSDGPAESGLETSLNQTAVPGATVEMTVTYRSLPLSDVEVFFNGESVGTTDETGTVIGTVPDDEELVVTIGTDEQLSPSLESDIESRQTTTSTATVSAGGAGPPRYETAPEPSDRSLDSAEDTTTEDEDPRDTHPIERTISIVTTDDPVPGGELLLTARIGDVLIDDATVTVDGEHVGETNESGQIFVELPDRSGEVPISVERDSLSGNETLTIPELDLTVDTGSLGSSAFGSATVTAEVDGEAAAGVPIYVDGEEVAVTGSDGTAEITLPLDTSATIGIETGGQTAQTTLSGLWYLPAAVGSFVVVFVTGIGYVLTRREVGLQPIVARVSSIPGIVVQRLSLLFVTAVTNGDTILKQAVYRLRRIGAAVVAVLTGKQSLGAVWRGAKGRMAGSYRRVSRTFSRGDTSETQSAGAPTVREAWRQFVDTLSAESATTRTPGELASHAIEEDGLPEQPVRTLRDTFREVEYGSRSETDRLDRIREAIEQIEESRTDHGGD